MGNGIFTRNYDNLLSIYQLGTYTVSSFSVGDTFGDGSLVVKYSDGALRINSATTNTYLPMRYFDKPGISSSGGTSLYFGANNTLESYEDTALYSPITVTSDITGQLQYLTPVNISQGYDEEIDCFKTVVKYPFICQKNCIVGEMGFYWYDPNMKKQALVYRKAFETPYELKVGDTFDFTFTLVIPMQMNKPVSIQTEEEIL